VLEDLINSFFKMINSDLKFKFSNIEAEKELLPNNKFSSVCYGDIVATLNNKDIINFEMYQDKFTKRELKKSFTYASLLYQKQRHKDNYEDLKKVISINFINHNYDNKNPNIINKYNFSHSDTREILCDDTIEMYLVRLDLCKNVAYNINEKRFITWLRIMTAESTEEMHKYANGVEIMENPIRVVTEWNNESRKTALDNYIEDKTHYAREEKAIEVIKNMLSMSMPINVISQATNFPINKIKSIAKKLSK
jgi:predicted transposase/invertase (TIGR01784 family)